MTTPQYATIYDTFFSHVPMVKEDVGVEIEVEFPETFNRTFSRDLMNKWIVKDDGSLRNIGREFITPGAITLGALPGSLLYIGAEVQPWAIKGSPRTSVHVHVNVQSLTLPQLVTGLGCMIMWDNILTEFCGYDRVGNNFCLRIKDAERWVGMMINSYNRQTPFNFGRDREYRYSSINCMSVTRFGTVEFRAMEGTTDPIRINEWTNLVYNLVHKSALAFQNPKEALECYIKDREEFISKTLDTKYVEILRKNVKDFDNLMHENVMLLMEYAEGTNWKMIMEAAKPKVKPASKKSPTANLEQTLLAARDAMQVGRTLNTTDTQWILNTAPTVNEITATGAPLRPRHTLDEGNNF